MVAAAAEWEAEQGPLTDAVVAETAARLHADVVTGDRTDIARLLDAAGADARIIDR